MSKRLITLRQIQREKLPRSRSWIFAELKAGRFPRPLDTDGCGPNLWEEGVVDAWLDQFIATAKARANDAAVQRSRDAQARVARRGFRGSSEARSAP